MQTLGYHGKMCLKYVISIIILSAGHVTMAIVLTAAGLPVDDIRPQELEVRSLYLLYSLKTKSSRCHYVVMTRSETKLSVAIPAPVSGLSAVNVATATSKCSITFLLPYDQDGDVKTKHTMSQIYFKSIKYRETYLLGHKQ